MGNYLLYNEANRPREEFWMFDDSHAESKQPYPGSPMDDITDIRKF